MLARSIRRALLLVALTATSFILATLVGSLSALTGMTFPWTKGFASLNAFVEALTFVTFYAALLSWPVTLLLMPLATVARADRTVLVGLGLAAGAVVPVLMLSNMTRSPDIVWMALPGALGGLTSGLVLSLFRSSPR